MRRILWTAAAVLSADWLSKALVVWLWPRSVAGDARPMGYLGLLILPVACWLGARRVTDQRFLLAMGLVLGASYANGLQRLLGPVVNFIPLPGSTADVADLCSMVGISLLFVTGIGKVLPGIRATLRADAGSSGGEF